LLQPLSGAACAAYNGELFLFGGELSSGVFSDRIHRYDPAQGTVVEELAILPTTILGSGRAHAAAVTVGTSIWVFGGSTVGGPSGGPYAELMEFVPQIGALFTQGFLPEARFGLAAAAVGSKVYLLGGSTLDFSVQPPKFLPKTQIWEFDTVARTFRTMTSVLPQALVFARAVTVGGKVYVVGGSDGETTVVTGFPHTTPALSDQLYVFDPTTDTITAAAPLPSGRQALVVAEVNGQIYAISGDTTTGLHDATAPWSYFTSETLTYDPAVDAWRVLRPIVTTLGGRSHAGGAAAGGRIYVLGGYTLPAAGVAVPPIPATQGRSDLISFFQP
jgi:N-acetylneuraminic acid mutarotase